MSFKTKKISVPKVLQAIRLLGVELVLSEIYGFKVWEAVEMGDVQAGVNSRYFHVHILDLVTPSRVPIRRGETKCPPCSTCKRPSCTTWLVFVFPL